MDHTIFKYHTAFLASFLIGAIQVGVVELVLSYKFFWRWITLFFACAEIFVLEVFIYFPCQSNLIFHIYIYIIILFLPIYADFLIFFIYHEASSLVHLMQQLDCIGIVSSTLLLRCYSLFYTIYDWTKISYLNNLLALGAYCETTLICALNA